MFYQFIEGCNFGLKLTDEMFKLIDFTKLGDNGVFTLMKFFRGDLSRKLSIDHLIIMHKNPKIQDSIEDISKMMKIPMSFECKDDFVNQLKTLKFKEYKSNAVTTLPLNHAL